MSIRPSLRVLFQRAVPCLLALVTACGGNNGNGRGEAPPAVVAPTALVYATNPAVYTLGQPIAANTPSHGGGAVDAYAVTPALPAGLALNATSGILTGTPTVVTASQVYTVQATNAGGSTTTQLSLAVQDVPPSNLTYTMPTATYTVGTPIPLNTPSTSGGGGLSFSVVPPLPAGLALHAVTGVISGTPTASVATAAYTITAGNSGGSTTATLTITVNATPTLAPAFTTQPANVTLIEGQSAQFVVAVSGTPTPTLQWQLRNNSFATWGNLASETSPTLNVPAATLAQNGFQFRAVATSSAGVTNSDVATLTVNAVPPSFTWRTAQLLETDNVNAGYNPQVAFNAAGNGMAVWYQADGTVGGIWSSRYVAGTGWQAATLIRATPTLDAGLAQVVMDANGNATAVWQQRETGANGGRNNIMASRYVEGSGWGTPTGIETNDSTAGDDELPQIAIDPNGNVIAVWNLMRAGSTTVWANRYAVGSGWAVASQIGTGNPNSIDTLPQIAVDGAGNGFAVWQQYNGPILNIWCNRYVVGTGWGSAALISDSAMSSRDPKIAADSNGNAIAVWGQFNPTTLADDIFANRYAVNTGWGTATVIQANTAKNNAYRPKIAFDANGNAMVAWYQYGSFGPYSIWANRYVAGSGWETETLIETNNAGDASNVSLGMDSLGNALVVWQQSDANLFREIYSNRYVVGTGWGTVALVEPGNYRTGQANLPQIAVNAQGKALVVWQRDNGGGGISSIWGNATQ